MTDQSTDTSVSVVIPAHNAAAVIERALTSTRAQTHPPLEIIVVDDGSSDETASIVERFGAPARVIHQANSGPSAARNRGVAEARGRWIAFLDADDEWLPHKLERQLELLAAHPALRWCSCNGEVVRAGNVTGFQAPRRALDHLANQPYFDGYFQARCLGARIVTSGTLVDAELLRRVGGFDESLWLGEDEDLWCRLTFVSPAVGFVREPCYRYHAGTPDSLTKTGNSTGYVLRSLMKTHELSRAAAQAGPDLTREHARYARTKVFRLLVRVLAGRERGEPELIRAYLNRYPLSRVERMMLAMLRVTPAALRSRLEGPIRDRHRAWHGG
jgi:glycosyltransferase involved in cell wall biosynthesis